MRFAFSFVFVLVAVVGIGCSAPVRMDDAGTSPADAADPLQDGCLGVYNSLSTHGRDCGWTRQDCPWSEPIPRSRVLACDRALYEARASCEMMRAVLSGC